MNEFVKAMAYSVQVRRRWTARPGWRWVSVPAGEYCGPWLGWTIRSEPRPSAAQRRADKSARQWGHV